jgi:ABC-type phosphate/phosphonate transport system permease subunit
MHFVQKKRMNVTNFKEFISKKKKIGASNRLLIYLPTMFLFLSFHFSTACIQDHQAFLKDRYYLFNFSKQILPQKNCNNLIKFSEKRN